MFTKVHSFESQSSACVLFFGKSKNVGCQTNLSLGFFLAISKIVVCQNCDHDATGISHGNLERLAIVVQFIFVCPANSLRLLQFRGLRHMWQAQILLQTLPQMRRKDYTPCCSCPVFRVQSSVTFREVGITSVAKDGFNKVQVGNTPAWNKEAHLQSLLGRNSWNLWAHQRTKLQGHHAGRRFLPVGSVRQGVQVFWGFKGFFQKSCIGNEGDGDLVGRDWQPIVSDVEDTTGGSLIGQGVVQNLWLSRK
mmetsp:Transcript_912/g.1642  ORF Transcript_912/g.1642 Transcript_912/m.1642 type:complete len:250 (+) Transcript_912:11-760(+)